MARTATPRVRFELTPGAWRQADPTWSEYVVVIRQGSSRRTVGRVDGHTGAWAFLGIGADRWTPWCATRRAAVNLGLEARNETVRVT